MQVVWQGREYRSGASAQKNQGLSIYDKTPPAFCASLNSVDLLTLSSATKFMLLPL
jgi:hypothetical protein